MEPDNREAMDRRFQEMQAQAGRERIQAMLDDNVDYFENRFETDLGLGSGGILLVAALAGGPRTAAWAAAKPLEQIFTERNCRELQMCLWIDVCKQLTEEIWTKGVLELLKIKRLADCAAKYAAMQGVSSLAKLHSIKKITREECLANNGEALQTADARCIKFFIKECKLSQSDFIALGIPWPVK
jgi:hypothetical protein